MAVTPDTLVPAPQIASVIPQSFIVEALGGAENPIGLLARFPDEIYHKSPESHLVRFAYALLGPAGIGGLSDNYLKARLILEEMGLQLFDLDAFFGNPFSFGRIFDEAYESDVSAPLDSEERERVQAKDAAYRNRALDYIGGVRLGNSPGGMRLVAKAGLGHDVEIVENYKYLYDVHSDRPVGYRYFGHTNSTEEMIVIPRQEVSTSEIQEISIQGGPTGGTFVLAYNGRTASGSDYLDIPFDAPAVSSYDPDTGDLLTVGIQESLESIPDIGEGNVRVTGGPGPDVPWVVTFQGALARQNTYPITVYTSSFTGGVSPQVVTRTIQGGVDSSQEVVSIPPRDLYNLQSALDRIKSVTTIPTVSPGTGTQQRQLPLSEFTASEFTEVLRFVTGLPGVPWPQDDWIKPGVEVQAPIPIGAASQHYQGFHDVRSVHAYTDKALEVPGYDSNVASTDPYRSEHIGAFGPEQRAIFPMLGSDGSVRYTGDRALADYPEQPITGYNGLINGIYQPSHASLPGTRQILYRDEQYWASVERTSGTDYLEIDLGVVQVVNFLAFETLSKPMEIEIAFDVLDQAPRRRFVPVTPLPTTEYPDRIAASGAGWTYLEFNFSDAHGDPIYTRFIRLALTRIIDPNVPFLVNPLTNEQYPWSLEVRNLRLGRNVAA